MSGQKTDGGRATGAPAPPLVEGEPFIPHKRFNGIWLPMGIFEHPKLSHGAKLLYGRLCLFAGKAGESYASLETLAREMLSSVDTVSRFLQELEKAGLIKRERRGHRQTAICRFLWHKSLKDSLKGASDSAELRSQDEIPIPQTCGSDSADLRGPIPQNCGVPIKEEKIQEEKIHLKESSSFVENASVAGSAPIEAEPSDDDEPISHNLEPQPDRQQSEPAAEWRPGAEEIEGARQCLALHRAGYGTRHLATEAFLRYKGEDVEPAQVKNLPDSEITRKVLSHFGDAEDFQRWITDLAGRFSGSKVKSWGFYATDAKHWPQRRLEVLARVEAEEAERRVREQAEMERRQREQREADALRCVETACREKGWKRVSRSACLQCAGYGRNPDTQAVCSCAAGVELQQCHACNDAGTITTWPEAKDRKTLPPMESWCSCQHAERARAELGPDYCERRNAEALASMRQQGTYQHQSDRWDELYRGHKQILKLIPSFKRLEVGFACSDDEAERADLLERFAHEIARCSAQEATFCRRAA